MPASRDISGVRPRCKFMVFQLVIKQGIDFQLKSIRLIERQGCRDSGSGSHCRLEHGAERHIQASAEGPILGRRSLTGRAYPKAKNSDVSNPAQQARCLPCFGMNINLSPRRRHRLLVVDDDQDCADSLSQLIAISSDWDVEVACGSAQALLQAASNPPDAVILDVVLTGLDGFETADRLSQATRDGGPSIFVVTGNADLQNQAAHDTRFAASMMKPVDADKLLRLMAKFD